MAIKIIETNLSFTSLSKRSSTKRIILHHAEATSCTPAQIHSWHKSNGWSGAGYHFLVRKDGKIYRLRPESMIGAHAQGANSDSIGICAEGAFGKETMSDTQMNSIIELIRYLKGKYPTINNVLRHKDVGDTNCPGTNYPYGAILKGLASSSTSTSSTAKSESSSKTTTTKSKSKAKFPLASGHYYGTESDGSNSHSGYNVKSERTAIKKIQKVVGTTADGLYGAKTKAAVKEYQSKNGLSADGLVGVKTWGKMFS